MDVILTGNRQIIANGIELLSSISKRRLLIVSKEILAENAEKQYISGEEIEEYLDGLSYEERNDMETEIARNEIFSVIANEVYDSLTEISEDKRRFRELLQSDEIIRLAINFLQKDKIKNGIMWEFRQYRLMEENHCFTPICFANLSLIHWDDKGEPVVNLKLIEGSLDEIISSPLCQFANVNIQYKFLSPKGKEN